MVSVRRRNRMGYKGYQGRGSTASGFLKALVVILAVLVVGGGGYLLALNGGISLPSWQPQQTAGTPQQSQTAQTQEPEDSQTQAPESSQTPEPTPTPSQAPTLAAIRGVEVSVSQLLDGSAQRLMEQAGCDTIVVEVKGEWGSLQWPSQAALAQQLNAVASTQSLTDALNTLSGQGVYLVARMDCFRDQALSAANVGGSLLMTKGGNRWYDSMGMSWVSPVNQQVRDYLTQVCTELSKMGFDEVVLDSACFPDQGEIPVLAQSDNYPQNRTAPVEQFLQQVTDAVKGQDVTLSIQVRGDSLLDGGANTGLTPQLLEQYGQRVWVTLDGMDRTQVDNALRQVGVEGVRQLVRQTAQSGQTIWG